MKKAFLPILLVLCTVLLLGLNVVAGSEGGERIAVLAKNTGTIDMTSLTKEEVFNQGSNVVTIEGASGGTATISAAWDEDALYFYVEVNDPNLSAFMQKYAAQKNKSDKQIASDYQTIINTKLGSADNHAVTDDPLNPSQKLSDRYATESANGAHLSPWLIPCFEIMIDPSNTQKASETTSKVYQGRVGYDGYNCSYVPITDAGLSYNMYSEDRFTSITNLGFSQVGKATGEYQIKMKFTAANLGESSFEDWQMISIHPFVRFATEAGSIETGYGEFDSVIKSDWDAPRYSYYRLWDPASTDYTGANAAEVASKYTETEITTKAPLTGIKPKPTSSKTTTKTPTSSSSTPAPGTSSSTPAPGTSSQAPATSSSAPQGGGEDKGGCGSVIGGAAAVIAATMIAAPIVILRKKDEE